MKSSNHGAKRSRRTPRAELLETRDLMTGGAGNTFALVPGTIAAPGGLSSVPFAISKSSFALPKNTVALGVDVAAPAGSTLRGRITHVTSPGLTPKSLVHSPRSTAVIATLQLTPRKAGAHSNHKVAVKAEGRTSGKFLVGFYLPGDVNGNGKVTNSDLNAVRRLQGSVSGDSRYNFDADSNRDGRINKADLALAQVNLGVRTNITPVVTADLDPASDTGVAGDRVTTKSAVKFSGTTSPRASVTYELVQPAGALAQSSYTTKADTRGAYSIDVPLVAGSNTFKVTSTDSFQQTISGQLYPVTQVATNTGSTTK